MKPNMQFVERLRLVHGKGKRTMKSANLLEKLNFIYETVLSVPNVGIYVCISGEKCKLINSSGAVIEEGNFSSVDYVETGAGPYIDLSMNGRKMVISSEYGKVIQLGNARDKSDGSYVYVSPLRVHEYFKSPRLLLYTFTNGSKMSIIDGNMRPISKDSYDAVRMGLSNQIITVTYGQIATTKIITTNGNTVRVLPRVKNIEPFLDIFTNKELYIGKMATGRGLNTVILSKRGELLTTSSISIFHKLLIWGGYLLTVETNNGTLYFDGRELTFKPSSDASIAAAITRKAAIIKTSVKPLEI